jgi:hypothetical protein
MRGGINIVRLSMKSELWGIIFVILASSFGSGNAAEYELEMQGVLNRPTFITDSLDLSVEIEHDYGAGYFVGFSRILPVREKIVVLIGITGSSSNYIRNTRREITRTYSAPYDTTSPAWMIVKHTFDVQSINIQAILRYSLGSSGLSIGFGHIEVATFLWTEREDLHCPRR